MLFELSTDPELRYIWVVDSPNNNYDKDNDMFSGIYNVFSPATPELPTRFNQTDELKQFFPLLKQLRDKEAELKAAADKYGVGTNDYRKHTVIAGILSLLDARIKEFNQDKANDDLEIETEEVRKLIKDLANIIRIKTIRFEFTLMLPRNNYREMAKTAVTLGTYTAIGIASTAVPVGWVGTAFALFVAAPSADKKAQNALGLNKPAEMTKSLLLLNDMLETLSKIGENIGLQKNWNKLPVAVPTQKIPDDFICPLGGNIMKKPVLCLLDKPATTCDEANIRNWLEKDGRSPFTRNPLGLRSIDEILVRNVAVENMIAEARLNNPSLFDDEAVQNNVSVSELKN